MPTSGVMSTQTVVAAALFLTIVGVTGASASDESSSFVAEFPTDRPIDSSRGDDLSLFGTVFYPIPETKPYGGPADDSRLFCVPLFYNSNTQCPHRPLGGALTAYHRPQCPNTPPAPAAAQKRTMWWGPLSPAVSWSHAAVHQSPRYCLDDASWLATFGAADGPTAPKRVQVSLRSAPQSNSNTNKTLSEADADTDTTHSVAYQTDIPPVALVLTQRQRHRHDIAIHARRNPNPNVLILEVGCNRRDTRACELAVAALTLMAAHCVRCLHPTVFVHRPSESLHNPSLDARVTIAAYTSGMGGAVVLPLRLTDARSRCVRYSQRAAAEAKRRRERADRDAKKRRRRAEGRQHNNSTAPAMAVTPLFSTLLTQPPAPAEGPSECLQPIVAAMWQAFATTLQAGGIDPRRYIGGDAAEARADLLRAKRRLDGTLSGLVGAIGEDEEEAEDSAVGNATLGESVADSSDTFESKNRVPMASAAVSVADLDDAVPLAADDASAAANGIGGVHLFAAEGFSRGGGPLTYEGVAAAFSASYAARAQGRRPKRSPTSLGGAEVEQSTSAGALMFARYAGDFPAPHYLPSSAAAQRLLTAHQPFHALLHYNLTIGYLLSAEGSSVLYGAGGLGPISPRVRAERARRVALAIARHRRITVAAEANSTNASVKATKASTAVSVPPPIVDVSRPSEADCIVPPHNAEIDDILNAAMMRRVVAIAAAADRARSADPTVAVAGLAELRRALAEGSAGNSHGEEAGGGVWGWGPESAGRGSRSGGKKTSNAGGGGDPILSFVRSILAPQAARSRLSDAIPIYLPTRAEALAVLVCALVLAGRRRRRRADGLRRFLRTAELSFSPLTYTSIKEDDSEDASDSDDEDATPPAPAIDSGVGLEAHGSRKGVASADEGVAAGVRHDDAAAREAMLRQMYM